MVLLICVAFVGQAMASTVMSYHMMKMEGMNAQEQSHDMSKMDHSNHKMMSEPSEADSSSSEDCCVKTCSCFAGGCSSLATLVKDLSHNPIIDLSSKISSYLPLALSQQPTSLYRPPIFS